MNALLERFIMRGKVQRLLFQVAVASAFLVASTGVNAYAQLTVASALTPEEMVTQIFAGVNAVVSNVQYTGAPIAIGTFTASGSNLGLEAGIVMTTGSIYNAIGPNADSNRTTENGTLGDPDLRKIHSIHDTVVVRDAAVLEFDFYSYADRMTFQYVFASEEYPEYVGSIYNDSFGFFISGPGYVGNENIALISGSATPVSINNVNSRSNAHLYIDNTNGATIEYDGFTVVLTAEASVIPCATYHLKLAIGDVSDELYDSGVFLKAGSFETGSSVYIAGSKDAIEGCGIGHFKLVRVGRTNHAISYSYTVSGSATAGVDYLELSGELSFEVEQDTGFVYVEALDDQLFDAGETVTITLKNNCGFIVDSATITIGETEGFSVQIAGDAEVCYGQPVQLQAFLGGGTGPYTYFWEPAKLSGTSIIHTPDSSRYYHVTVTDSSNGCQARDSFYVRVYDLELDKSDDLYLCPAGEGVIGTPATGGKQPYVYDWEPKTGISSYNEATPTAFPENTTDYIVTVSDAIGCVAFDTIRVKVSELRVFTPGDDTLCTRGSKRIAATAEWGGGEYKYRWEPAIGVSDTTARAPLFSPPFTTQYRVLVTDKFGCVVADSFTLYIGPELIVQAGPDLRICPGLPTQIGNGAQGGMPPYEYRWEPPGDLEDPTAGIPTIIPVTTRTYRVHVTDAFGCEAEDVVTVRVEPTVIANAGPDTTMCHGASKTLQGRIFGGVAPYDILWRATPGVNDSLALQPLVTPDTTTTYHLTVTDTLGCTFTDSVTITVTPLPRMAVYASGPATVCAPDVVRLFSEQGFARYLWSNGDTTETIAVAVSGTYGVTAWTAEGCKAHSDSIRVTIHELPPVAILGPASVCIESRSVYHVAPAPPGFTYTWNVTGGTIKDRINNSITVVWDGTPMSMVSLTVLDPRSGCTKTVDYPVEVAATLRPVVSFEGDSIRCAGDSLQLHAGFGYMSYLWSTGDTTESILVSASGIYSVTVMDSSGCSGASNPVPVEFRSISVPDISINGPAVLCDGDSTTLKAPNGFVSYVWTDSVEGRVRTVSEPGSYAVAVTDAVGCTGISNTLTIEEISLPGHTISGPSISCVNGEAQYSVEASPDIELRWQCTGGTIVGDPTAPAITVRWTTEGKGLLTLDVTKNGVTCAMLYRYTVDVVLNFEFDITVEGADVFCADTGVVLRAPKGFQQYHWSNGARTDSVFVQESGLFWVSITDIEGCEGISDTVQTTAVPSPAAIVEPMGPADLCEGDSVVLRSQFIHQRYLWSNGATTRSIVVTTPGEYTLTATNSEGCSATSVPFHVRVSENPVPIIQGPGLVCQEGTERYITPAHPGAVFTWTVRGGRIVAGDGSNAVDILWETAGTGSIDVLETTSGGCIGVAETFSLTILPAPRPTIVRSGETLTASGNWVAYQWLLNGTNIPGADGNTHTMRIPGSYTVKVLDDQGCQGTSGPEIYEPFATSTIGLANVKALPGERVFLPVVVTASTGFLDASVDSFSAILRFNASVLFPTGGTPMGTVENGIRRIPVSGSKITDRDTLAMLEFTAMLGNASRSTLEFESFAWDNPAVLATTGVATAEIVICREGGERLFSDTGVLAMAQNSPNPYNSSTVIAFHLIERGHTRLVVLDMLGREVAVIVDAAMEPGNYRAYFDASNLASGAYVYVLTTPTARLQRMMRLMK